MTQSAMECVITERCRHKRLILFPCLLFAGLIALVTCAIVSIDHGAIAIPFRQAIHALWQRDHSTDSLIIYSSRLPRTLIAIFTGAAFGAAGCIMQAISRNPLACPSVLGINQGAALSIVIMLLLLPGIGTSLFVPMALIGGMLAAMMILVITASVGMSPLRLALAGVSVNALFHAVSRCLLILFPSNAQSVVFSIMGSLAGRNWMQVDMVVPWIIIGLSLSYFSYRYLNIFCLGQEQATGLGLNSTKLQFLLLLLAVMLAAAAVSVVGPIPFVGLIVPNALRYIIGSNYKHLLPLSMIYGALLLLFSDTLLRLINPVVELPVGIMVALIGGPFFVLVARTHAKRGMA